MSAKIECLASTKVCFFRFDYFKRGLRSGYAVCFTVSQHWKLKKRAKQYNSGWQNGWNWSFVLHEEKT